MTKYRKITALSAALLAVAMSLSALTALAADEYAAAVSAFCKNDGEGRIITFSQSDFTQRVTGREELSAIVVSTLPEGGTLRLAGLDVRAGEAIETERLGALSFVPELGQEVHTGFTFLPVFSRSGAGREAVTVSLNISNTPNSAPVAVEQTFETYADLTLYGRLKAVDADGDPCTFAVERQGRRGTAQITETGFCYEPNGKSGEDVFTVVAVDTYGNRSQPAEITVRVRKRHAKERFTYTDMAESTAHYAALRLREEGVFSGECFGSEAFFAPQATVTRAQFLTMAASVTQLAMPTAAVSTGLSDDDSLPAWSRSYVAAGILSGVVEGSEDGMGNRVFQAEKPITRAEAAAIVDRCLSLADDRREMAFADREDVPAWAAQAVVNTAAAGLLPVYADDTVRPQSELTREEAAVMLYRMTQLHCGD